MTIVIIIVAVIVLALIVALAGRAGRERKLQARREHASELRETAQAHSLEAERERATADQQAARAQQAQAKAVKQAELAREHAERADTLDPDVEADTDERDEARANGVDNGRQAPAESGRTTI